MAKSAIPFARRLETIKVEPKNETLRRIMRHPGGGPFPPAGGPADWPLDQFTLRRLQFGDVTRVEQTKQ